MTELKHLKQLCEDLNIDFSTVLEDQNIYTFSLSENIVIRFISRDPGMRLESTIGPCPEEKSEELFIKLMNANLFCQGTLGGVIGLTPDDKLLTLSSSFPYDMDYRDFRHAIEDFANILDYWRVEIAEHKRLAQGGIL